MSEREEFEAWLNTWALPGNTSREDAMYAAWQARAARTASAEPVAWVDIPPGDQQAGCYPGYKFEGLSNLEPGKYHLYTAPDALQAEVERLRDEVERLQSENQSLLMQCTGMGNSIDELKRSLQNEVNRRNQYAMESGELDRQVEALTNSNKACEDCFIEMRAERDALKSEAQFLIERLNSLEFTDMDDLVRDWYGHVVPSLSRLQALTAKPEVKS
ncbi:hypothetical protein VPH49_09730 [Pseudomonas luteola]|uniref:hypothetical protein n=1 Tax=Pseudomonas luteola TaxID=47886 RepID=UPI003A866246